MIALTLLASWVLVGFTVASLWIAWALRHEDDLEACCWIAFASLPAWGLLAIVGLA